MLQTNGLIFYHANNLTPRGMGWNGYSAIVFDNATFGATDGSLFYYGQDIPAALPAGQTMRGVRQFYGLDRWTEKFDIAKIGTDNSLDVRAVGVEGIRQSALALLETILRTL